MIHGISWIYVYIYISIYRHYFLTYTVYCNYIQLSYVKDLQDISGARNLHLVELGTHQQKMYVFCRSPPKKNMVFDSRTTWFSISRDQQEIYIYIYTTYIIISIYIYIHFGCLWGLINKTQILSTKSKQKRPAGPDVIHFWEDLNISQETKLEDAPSYWGYPLFSCCCGCSSKVPQGI